MAALPDPILPRVASLLRLLGSDQDHEALGAVRSLRRTLGGVGLDLHALADFVEHPAPAVVLQDALQSAASRRNRKVRPDTGHIEWRPTYRREVREALEMGLARLTLSTWERDFVANIIGRIRAPHGLLTFRQAEIVDRLLAKIEGSR